MATAPIGTTAAPATYERSKNRLLAEVVVGVLWNLSVGKEHKECDKFSTELYRISSVPRHVPVLYDSTKFQKRLRVHCERFEVNRALL
nr:hypothetical protein DM860_017732 [Ipomoea trifida]